MMIWETGGGCVPRSGIYHEFPGRLFFCVVWDKHVHVVYYASESFGALTFDGASCPHARPGRRLRPYCWSSGVLGRRNL